MGLLVMHVPHHRAGGGRSRVRGWWWQVSERLVEIRHVGEPGQRRHHQQINPVRHGMLELERRPRPAITRGGENGAQRHYLLSVSGLERARISRDNSGELS